MSTVLAVGGGGFSVLRPTPTLDQFFLDLTGKSRPRIYQMIGEIRQAFQEAGLAPSGGAR